MKNRWRRTKIKLGDEREARTLKIVGDGALSIPEVNHSKIVPLVIVDTSDRPDVEEYVRIHQGMQSGDVETQWGRRLFGKERWLHIKVIRPVELNMFVGLNIERNTQLINMIIKSKALYLQPGRPGDKLSNTFGNSKVLIGVQDTGFGQVWASEYYKQTVSKLRKKGLSRADAKRAAHEHIKTMTLLEDWSAPLD